jgi:AcrR family transcriptional regulator
MYKIRWRAFNERMETQQVPAVAPRGERRQAILLAAERLFAQRGYHGVTIRQIAEQAAVPLALVGYYFGPKHELFHAIFEQWRHTVDERLALLAQARRGESGGNRLRAIVSAFVEPVLQLRASAEGEAYALLVARELAYRTPEAERVLGDFFDPMAHAFIDALHGACPGSTRPQAAWAYQFALGALIHHISDHRVQRLSLGKCRSGDAAGARMLVEFIVGGIEAALPAPPGAPNPAPPQPRTRRRQA